jgi:hypothetical protein
MLRRVAFIRTYVSEEPITSIIRITSSSIVFLRGVLRLLLTANVVSSSSILLALTMQEIHSSETSVITRATQRNTSKDGILHSHVREKFKSKIAINLPVRKELTWKKQTLTIKKYLYFFKQIWIYGI